MGAVAIEDVLFPRIDVRVTAMHVTEERVAVEASSCGRPPACPDCGCPGRRVHSRNVRRVTERPVLGQPLVISLKVRRFFRERASYRRRTFAEQVLDLSERYRCHGVGLR
ncbi:transposase family protein [Streptomyces mirabilis]|uniref:transposase family protein n=1 Tax=Streptomyces mirabilis TaxID=68239 RepID=UPI003665706B